MCLAKVQLTKSKAVVVVMLKVMEMVCCRGMDRNWPALPFPQTLKGVV
jgi:hypothetical protein